MKIYIVVRGDAVTMVDDIELVCAFFDVKSAYEYAAAQCAPGLAFWVEVIKVVDREVYDGPQTDIRK